MTDETNTDPGGMDRRSLIKRAGIVGAGVAAWSTPMVTSLAGKAYAVGSPTTGCTECGLGGPTCANFTDCGPDCICAQNVAQDACACLVGSTPCDSQTCASQADCPPGTVCAVGCCDAAICVPTCEHGAKAPARRDVGGRTFAGR